MYYDRNFKTYQLGDYLIEKAKERQKLKEEGKPVCFEDMVESKLNEIIDFVNDLSDELDERNKRIDKLEEIIENNCINPFV